VYSSLPSALIPMPHGLAPMSSKVRVTVWVATSMTEIDLARPLVT
jgi:hypothetical protein